MTEARIEAVEATLRRALAARTAAGHAGDVADVGALVPGAALTVAAAIEERFPVVTGLLDSAELAVAAEAALRLAERVKAPEAVLATLTQRHDDAAAALQQRVDQASEDGRWDGVEAALTAYADTLERGARATEAAARHLLTQD